MNNNRYKSGKKEYKAYIHNYRNDAPTLQIIYIHELFGNDQILQTNISSCTASLPRKYLHQVLKQAHGSVF